MTITAFPHWGRPHCHFFFTISFLKSIKTLSLFIDWKHLLRNIYHAFFICVFPSRVETGNTWLSTYFLGEGSSCVSTCMIRASVTWGGSSFVNNPLTTEACEVAAICWWSLRLPLLEWRFRYVVFIFMYIFNPFREICSVKVYLSTSDF